MTYDAHTPALIHGLFLLLIVQFFQVLRCIVAPARNLTAIHRDCAEVRQGPDFAF